MIKNLLDPYTSQIEKELANSLVSFGPKSRLRDAIEYALKNGGKRFRPAIVFAIANALNKNSDVTDAALAIEFFHTASLIADDLPCMDNDPLRRDVPTLHLAFDEATALLATYALISAGYDRIRLNAKKQNRDDIGMLAIECASLNTGILGAAGGQYFDLFPQELKEADILEVIEKKTGTLFEISFVFGWLFGGGEEEELPAVKKAACHFGRAFQISDDLLDFNQDKGKLNFAVVLGSREAKQRLWEEVRELKGSLKKLRLECPELLALVQLIEKRAQTPAISFS